MKLKSILIAAAAAASLSSAFAFDERVIEPTSAPFSKSRAEVLADLEIYRVSGLAELESHDGVDRLSPRYLHARRLYNGLRNSSNFDRLVQNIAQKRGEANVTTASNERGGSTQQ